jgi:ankyrin repeat protein
MNAHAASLVRAIKSDDLSEVEAALNRNPEMARGPIFDADHLDTQFNHWLYRGDTALHLAAVGYRETLVARLLEAGADARACGNRRRSQPLHYASDGSARCAEWNPTRQVAVIQLLIQAGADVHAQDRNGATPLHRAVRTRCSAAVKCLLEAGADPVLRNESGSTAFHLAVQNTGRGNSGSPASIEEQREIIRAFLDHGVPASLADAEGKSILDWARSDWIRTLLTPSNR